MILNDITNDSATTLAESDIYRANGKKKNDSATTLHERVI